MTGNWIDQLRTEHTAAVSGSLTVSLAKSGAVMMRNRGKHRPALYLRHDAAPPADCAAALVQIAHNFSASADDLVDVTFKVKKEDTAGGLHIWTVTLRGKSRIGAFALKFSATVEGENPADWKAAATSLGHRARLALAAPDRQDRAIAAALGA
jgi:hypothetical protein